MRTTTVFVALIALIAVSADALAQDAPQRPRAPGNQQGPNTQAPQAPLPEDVPTVSLEELLEGFERATGREFMIDVRSRRNVYLGGTEAENITYPVLLAVLRSNQLVAVEIGGRINVLPEAFARQLPVRLVQEDDADIPDDEVVSRIVQMNNMNAPQAVPILRPLLPQYAHLAALPEENVVLIVDRYANVRRLTELLNALDN